MAIPPDTKDWTWVLDAHCPECGFEAGSVPRERLGHEIRASAELWTLLLTDPAATRRRDPQTWSTAEYACHVRDVHRIFGTRVQLMLTQETPAFADWDQDAAAIEGVYAEQDPALVGAELVEAAASVAASYDSVTDDPTWSRRGVRSNGSEFTVESLGRYQLHDLLHHAWDVRDAVARATVAAYDAHAESYREGTATLPEPVRARLDTLVAAVGPSARILEVGSGAGRDATYLEEHGLAVRRTDITPAFVELMRAAGHEADVVDPLVDELDDPAAPDTPYDGVWANASLLHVARTDLPTVLERLAGATRVGGALMASVKAGDGEGWATHGGVAAPRRFVYWRADALVAVLTAAGWQVDEVATRPGRRGESWVLLDATRT